ncbi:hypothetical protein AKJ16_DCAP00590 [Drosera capensis]
MSLEYGGGHMALTTFFDSFSCEWERGWDLRLVELVNNSALMGHFPFIVGVYLRDREDVRRRCAQLGFLITGLMETQKNETAANQSGATSKQPATSCRKKKNEEAKFLEDVKDHIDEFINASMDEHATCFKKTIHKMFGMSKIIAKQNAEAKEVETVLPLQTTISE